ncbi:hypothetical protein ILYODFUR_033130 [Ilyodon furcidens]|uniref:Uncharacterized protein n=1 Tax=Ilyodon furcidens TaxID=33524 RepID=A0ABV0TSK6_9TELE
MKRLCYVSKIPKISKKWEKRTCGLPSPWPENGSFDLSLCEQMETRIVMIVARLLYHVSLAAISRLDAPGGCCSVVQSVACHTPVSSLLYTDSDKQMVPDF